MHESNHHSNPFNQLLHFQRQSLISLIYSSSLWTNCENIKQMQECDHELIPYKKCVHVENRRVS